MARAALHPWEEPPISGVNGSGTVFFSGCALGCRFCQNDEISHKDFGEVVSVSRLRVICEELIAQGAHNINLVNPSHYAHTIAELVKTPFSVPIVWNTGGYDRVETLKMMEGKVDIYLPDLKYMDGAIAKRYSDAEDYPEVTKRAIIEMVRQTGPVQMEDGILRRGVIIRHLLLPTQVEGAKAVMDWVAETFPRGMVLFSLMSQYTPWGDLTDYPELNRTLRKSEVRAAQQYMDALGLDGFVQDGDSAQQSYTPRFDLTGIAER